MTEIDFLPADYWTRRASRRDQWYLLGLVALAIVLLVGNMIHESRKVRHLRAQLASLATQRDDLRERDKELARLEAYRVLLASEASFHSLLQARPSLSRVMVAVATSCPPRLTVDSIKVKPEKPGAAEAKRAPGGTKSTAPSSESGDAYAALLERVRRQRDETQLLVHIEGVAESHVQVAELIERLERCDCFAEVAVQETSLDEQAMAHTELQAFKIQCRLAKVL